MRANRVSLAITAVTVMTLVALGAAQRPVPAPPPSPPLPMPAILKAYPTVTAERLLKPSGDEWLMIRRTYDGWGYSPLDQITPANVARLQPVWVVLDRRGERPRGGAARQRRRDVRLDARQPGDCRRREDGPPPLAIPAAPPRRRGRACTRRSRGVALYGDKVYLPANEGVLVALDARTGKEVWTAQRRREPARLLHDAGSAGSRRPRHDWRLGRRVRHPRIRRRVRRRDREAGCGRPTQCPRPASPAARRGRPAISGRRAAPRYG